MITDNNTINPAVFRELSDYALDGIVMTDMNLKILYANRAAHTMFGYAEGEMIGQNAATLWPEEDLPKLQALMPQIMSGGWNGEAQNKRKDGSVITVSSAAFSVGGGDGRTPTALAVMVRDMSERKQAEEALDQQNRILQTLLENMPFATFMVEAPSGKPVMANRKATEFLGRGVMPDATGDTLAEVYQAYRYGTDEVYPAPEMPVVRGMFGETSHVDDMEVRRPDGTKTLLEVYGTPVYDKEHKVCWSLVNFVDITQRKQAEEALDQRNRIWQTLLENMPFATFMVEVPSGKPVMANQKAIEFLGRGIMPDATGDTLAEVYQAYRYGTDEVYPAPEMPVVRGMFGETSHVDDMEVRRPDGTKTLLEVYGTPVYDKEHKVCWSLVNFVDITQRKQAEVERELLQQEIIEAQRRTLQELSTPIIPVMERIIVMPLVGSIDSLRARDITRSLLAGIREHRAKIVILDITGVPLVDSGVASHLNKTIQAARLKGARTIITGVSDAVAETVVDLGIDWSGVETLANLQTGLAAALGSLGIELVKRKM